jgi:hypothetical protein
MGEVSVIERVIATVTSIAITGLLAGILIVLIQSQNFDRTTDNNVELMRRYLFDIRAKIAL